MIYMVIFLGIAMNGIVTFFVQKILSHQKQNHTNLITILNELNELQLDNLEKHAENLIARKNSILKEIALLYDLVNTHTHTHNDTYLINMSKKYKKIRTLM